MATAAVPTAPRLRRTRWRRGRIFGRGGGGAARGLVGRWFGRPIHASKNGKYIVPDRFRDAGEYIEDKWTGLLWQKDGNTIPQKNYQQAMDYARKAKLGTVKTGWRVPTAAEFTTIYPANFEPFKNTGYKEWDVKDPVPAEARNYWTCELDTRQKDYAYVYHWYGPGGPNNCTASQNFVNVRLVHDALGKR